MSKIFLSVLLAVSSFSFNSKTHQETTTTVIIHGHHPHPHPNPAEPNCSANRVTSVFCMLTLATYGAWTAATLYGEVQNNDILAGGAQGAIAILSAADANEVANIVRNDPSLQDALKQILREKGDISITEAADLIVNTGR